MRLFLLPFFLIAFFPLFAHAGEVVQCGAPKKVDLDTDAGDYCDIYARQAAYGEQNKELRDQIDERRRNYQEPRSAARETARAKQIEQDAGYAAPESEPAQEAGPINLLDDDAK